MIGLTNSKKKQAKELGRNEEIMAYLVDKLVILNNNSLLFKNNVKYTWAKFMQDSKITKGSMGKFFNNPNLAPIQIHFSSKNMDEIKTLLTKLLYDKII